MNDFDPPPETVDPTVDDEIGVILERYLQQRESGQAVSREEFLAQHPQFATRLAACLDGIEFFKAANLTADSGSVRSGQPHSPHSIGDFELLGELGRGGMGVVYEAREKSLDRIVALKVMRFGVVDPRALERFQREAETAGALHHTNIVPVYATGREGDTSWYAMQRIEGESLAHRIRRAYENGDGPIPVEEILRVGIQAAEALHHAHERDVIHRDVKPANLIVDGEDRVWLTDFGLARRLVDVGATMTGAILGTPRYMSPEQANLRRVEVDHRTDIYSLGATLYEMATGRPLFDGDDPLKVIGQIRYDDPPSPRSLRPGLPRDLDVVLSKCLEKEADRRYATAAELADDLRAIRDDRAIRARAVSLLERLARWTRRHQSRVRVAGITVLATVTMILLSVFGWQTWRASTLGSFRLRAAGGPYMTSIHSVSESSVWKAAGEFAVELTVPMQRHQKLPIGDYDMLLAPRGRWSRKLRLPVTGGLPTEYRLRSAPSRSREISIEDAWAAAVSGFDEPAVLLRRDGELQRTTLSGDDEWTLDVRRVETTLTRLPGINAEQQASTRLFNFAHTTRLTDTPRSREMLDDNPQYCAPPLALRTAIDLDGDDRADSLVAATDRPALLAIDAQGQMLWARGYDLNGVSFDGESEHKTPYGSPFTLPGIIGLTDVGDRNADGIHDVAALLAHIQPGIQSDVCLALLSGKTGEALQAIHLPPLIVADNSPWPQDGILRVIGSNQRQPAALSFSASHARRSSMFTRPGAAWGSGRRPDPSLAMPSPLQVVAAGERLVAIYHAGKDVRRFDLDTGEEIGPAISLPFMPATGAKIARIGDGAYALIFHERESRSQTTPQGNQDATRVVAYGLEGSLLWEHFVEYTEWRETAWLRNKADWPLAQDVDGDGRDEVLLPVARYRSGLDFRIEMLNSADGSLLWPTASPFYQLVGTGEQCLHRMALSSDIDGDGWREWVTASIAGPPSPGLAERTTAKVGEAFVYVDWISGKTGEPIAWARHPIPIVSDAIRVAEIDAIRCDIPGGGRGLVEVDFVTGDSSQDTELESMVLRFHPSTPDATEIATGLDVVSGVGQTAATRIYHMRPGPFAEGAERLMLLGEEGRQTLRLGEQTILSVWKARSGRKRIAVQGFEPSRLSVVDAETQQTVWTTARQNAQSPSFTPLVRDDGRTDFLVRWREGRGDEPPTLIDGETGESKWTMSAEPGGRLIDVRMAAQNWILIVGDGHGSPGPNNARPPDAFKMSLVNAASGWVRWSTYFLYDAPRHNYPNNFRDLQVADVNGDGFPDVIGPDHERSKKSLLIAAWDRATGERLWTRPLFRTGPTTDYFVPFCVLRLDDHAVVAYIGPETEADAKKEASLILCHAATGEQLTARKLPDSQQVLSLDRENTYMRLAIANCSTANEPRIGLLNYHLAESAPRWTLFGVKNDSLSEVMSWQPQRDSNSTGQGVWLRDVNGDSIPERFVATQLQSLTKRMEDGSILHLDNATVIARYELDATEPTWEVPIERSYAPRIIWHDDPDVPTACLQVDPNGFACIDVMAGERIATFDNPVFHREHLPRVLAIERHERGTGVHVAEPSEDGLVSRWLGDVRDDSSDLGVHSDFDPRRTRRLLSHRLKPSSFAVMLRDAARSLATVLILAFVPLGYVGTMVRRRQFSLSWMMLAPPVVLLFLIVWNSSWVNEPSLIANFLSGVGFLAGGAAIYVTTRERDAKDFLWGKGWLLVAIAATLFFGVLLGSEYVQADDSSIRYLFTWQDAALLLVASLCLAGQLYWVARFVRGVWSWRGRRRRKALA